MTAMRARDRQAASGLAADFKNEPQPAIRAWILRALAAVPVSRGAAVMSAALHDNSALVRLAAAEALARTSGAEAVAQLAAALETESNPGVRHAITDCLGSIKTADSAAALQRALAQDSDANVRAQAARSLRRHGERVGRARKVSGAP